jgi:hypothetical protein
VSSLLYPMVSGGYASTRVVSADGGESREGWVALGEEPDDLDEPCDTIGWRDNRGWYHVEHQDQHGGLGNGPYPLPGLDGLTPPQHEVAAAVLRAFPSTTPLRCSPWLTPDGYDPDPPVADGDGFAVNAALERSLVAYVKPCPA